MNEETKPANLAQRVADLERLCDTTAAHVAMIARQFGDEALQVDDIAVRVLALVAERDELRAKYDELLVALHGIGRALGLAEGARSPYSITCGVLERVNRLAEVEAQEPVAISKAGNLFWAGNPQDWRGVDCNLYAAPSPQPRRAGSWSRLRRHRK